MPQVDYIITGGGAAGLSLVIQMLRSDLKDRSVLIIDRDGKNQNDRTWCFWTDQPSGLDEVIQHSWQQIRFANQGFNTVLPLGNYRYHKIRGIDFYHYAREIIRQHPNVHILQGSVDSIQDSPECATVTVDVTAYQAGYAFGRIQTDSRAIVRSLVHDQHPFDIPLPVPRYRLYDSLILQIMLHHPHDCAALCSAMFKHNSVPRIFRFLDEDGALSNDLRLIASLPPGRFIQAWVRRLLGIQP